MLSRCVLGWICINVSIIAIYTLPTRARTMKNLHDDMIAFPEDSDDGPTCPNNHSFCEEVPSYPKQKFGVILKKLSYIRKLLVDADTSFFDEDEMATRFDKDIYYICPTRRRRIYPKAAKNTKGVFRYLYNFDAYKQSILIEQCSTDSSCGILNVPQAMVTKCTQKYIQTKLFAADPNGFPDQDVFLFPSGCACAYWPTSRFKFHFQGTP